MDSPYIRYFYFGSYENDPINDSSVHGFAYCIILPSVIGSSGRLTTLSSCQSFLSVGHPPARGCEFSFTPWLLGGLSIPGLRYIISMHLFGDRSRVLRRHRTEHIDYSFAYSECDILLQNLHRFTPPRTKFFVFNFARRKFP